MRQVSSRLGHGVVRRSDVSKTVLEFIQGHFRCVGGGYQQDGRGVFNPLPMGGRLRQPFSELASMSTTCDQIAHVGYHIAQDAEPPLSAGSRTKTIYERLVIASRRSWRRRSVAVRRIGLEEQVAFG